MSDMSDDTSGGDRQVRRGGGAPEREGRDPARDRSREPLSVLPEGAPLSPEDEAQVEWERDQLVALMGRYLSRRLEAPANRHAGFLEWLTRELRNRPPGAYDWTPEQVGAMRERIRRRAAAERCLVRLVEGPAPRRPASVPGRVEQIIDEAALEGCVPAPEPRVAAGGGCEVWEEFCETWVERPRGIPRGRYLVQRVDGDSMTPLLHEGDDILIRLDSRIEQGDVAVVWRPGEGYVVKRVTSITPGQLELASLNRAYAPIRVPNERRLILGKVILGWCTHAGETAASVKA